MIFMDAKFLNKKTLKNKKKIETKQVKKYIKKCKKEILDSIRQAVKNGEFVANVTLYFDCFIIYQKRKIVLSKLEQLHKNLTKKGFYIKREMNNNETREYWTIFWEEINDKKS